MLVIIDYNMGNIGSIRNMLKKVKCTDVVITRDEKIFRQADKFILPGVGAFDAGMSELEKYGIDDMIKELVIAKEKPLLGICLGMQLLGKRSEEGLKDGLGLIPFESKHFKFGDDKKLKVPHMCWNYTDIVDTENPLVKDLDNNQRYYFVHSYYAKCEDEKNVLMRTSYGLSFSSAVYNENVYGVQFHPEKSHKYGMKLMKNFVEVI